jgi:hypothetical protein
MHKVYPPYMRKWDVGERTQLTKPRSAGEMAKLTLKLLILAAFIAWALLRCSEPCPAGELTDGVDRGEVIGRLGGARL